MTAWNLNPSIVGGLLTTALAYGMAIRRGRWVISRSRLTAFAAAMLGLALALSSPIDELADRYLFLAHMLQHLVLLLLIPPLVLAGLPGEAFACLWRSPVARTLLTPVASPLPALLISVAAIWVWHVPALYEAGLRDEALHALEHLCFLGSATLFWWPIARPATYPWPMPDLLQLVYLFGAAVSSTTLAALITFSADVLYPTYALGGNSSIVRAAFGLTPLADQQIGGLTMWVGAGAWYGLAAALVFFRWSSRAEAEDRADATSSLE